MCRLLSYSSLNIRKKTLNTCARRRTDFKFCSTTKKTALIRRRRRRLAVSFRKVTSREKIRRGRRCILCRIHPDAEHRRRRMGSKYNAKWMIGRLRGGLLPSRTESEDSGRWGEAKGGMREPKLKRQTEEEIS